MVKDRFNEYYTSLYGELAKTWPKLQKTTKLTLSPPKLPVMYMRQIGGAAKVDTLSGTSEERDIGIEVQFLGAKQGDVRSLADAATEYMVEKYFFRCSYSSPMDNPENADVYRFICRFEKTDV